jgi:hypothetical protein
LEDVFKRKLNSRELVSSTKTQILQNYNERQDRKFDDVDNVDNDEVHGLDDNHPEGYQHEGNIGSKDHVLSFIRLNHYPLIDENRAKKPSF